MHIIAGIDTGKTCAVVCFGLDGRLLYSEHRTSAGAEWLITTIRSIGTPVIIACDKEPNDTARKICAAFNARLSYPRRMMTALEKRDASRPYHMTNMHESDACAAAVKAYHVHANKLNQAEHIAKEMNFTDVDGIRAKVISKFSISEAIAGRKANRR